MRARVAAARLLARVRKRAVRPVVHVAPGAAHTQRETSSSALTSSLLSLDDMAVSRAGEERKKASVAGKTDGFALGALP